MDERDAKDMIGRFKHLFSATENDVAEEKTDVSATVSPPTVAEGGPALSLADVEREYCTSLLSANALQDVPLSDLEHRVLDEITALLASPDTACDALPRLPEVLPRLMRSLRDERASWEEIARVVGQDPLLVAEVLRLANSPCFRVTTKVTCLEQVVMQLGLVGLREVVVTVSLKPIMKLDGGRYWQQAGRRVWTQALAAAVACRSLALSLDAGRFEAYLAGLLHNVGMVLVVQSLSCLSQGDEAPRSIQFYDQIQPLVKRLSCLIARHWDLPAASVEALRERAGSALAVSSPLGRILRHGVHLSMLQALVEDGQVEDSFPYLCALPDAERRACEQALGDIEAQTQSL